jgi:uncharacterized protein (TIGR00251 family)
MSNLPPYMRQQGDTVVLSVKVQPRSSRNQIGPVAGQELKVKVTAPPVDAAANEALVRLLADQLDCSRGAVRMLRGQTSRHKVLTISGMSAEVVADRLAQSDGPSAIHPKNGG